MVAAIIGPFSKPGCVESGLQFFHIKNNQPYRLTYRVVAQQLLSKSFVVDLKQLF